MSSHMGVSCDCCSKANFSGRRYKCLSCDNYDLCGLCHDINAESQNHLHVHPMQCILTKTAHELFYAGESISHQTIVSLTCPYCGVSGFVLYTLLKHCLEKHSIISAENNTNQIVMCPICVINPTQGYQSRFVSLVDHLVREHDDENTSLFVTERLADKKEDYDQDEDEDEGLPLYVLAERLFTKEDNHRQRLAQTIVRNASSSMGYGNATSQPRPLSRHSAIRGSRGNTRGHFNNYPYGTVPRTTTGSFRIPFDTTIENSISTDPYATILFSQDPLLEVYSSFSDLTTNAPFFLTSAAPTHIPGLQTATSDRIIPKKSNIPNSKQKRSSHVQQSMILTEPSLSDYQLWQQSFPPSLHTPKSLSDTDKPIEIKSRNDQLSTNSEHDPRSLLGKILKTESDNEQIRILSQQDHASFFHSLVLSSIHISINKA